MKKIIFYFLVVVSFSLTSSDVSLNLTGTYETKKNIDKNGYNLGNEGFLMVKDLGNSKIKLQLEYYGKNSDYGPNMAELSVVLYVKSNKAVYYSKEYGTCKIEFLFDPKGVEVKMIGESTDFSCGFGGGVYVDGYYYKKSSKSPEFREY
jgi:hypothetical protein